MTRNELTRVLAVNAVTKPANVLAPAAVLVAALLLGVVWLVPIAAVCWLALVAATFFDEREARAVAERARTAARREPPAVVRAHRFAPEIAARVRAASAARAAIADVAADDVCDEVDALVQALHRHAGHAQRIRDFLAGKPNADPAALGRLNRRLDAMYAEMDQVVAALQTVHAELLAADGREEEALVADLRAKVQAVSAGLEAAFSD